jgi:hypothetical protein
MHSDQQTSTKSRALGRLLTYLLLTAAVLLIGATYIWQHKQVTDLGKQVSVIKNTQLPQKKFSDIDDCINNGGVDVQTINAQFEACLGGPGDSGNEVFLRYSAQNLPRLEEQKTVSAANQVVADGNISASLIGFLKHDDGGCASYFKVLKEVPERFAEMNTGCGKYDSKKTQSFVIAMKLGNGWALISPTNNINAKGVPSCLMVDMFKISKFLASECFETTGFDNGTLKARSYP